MSKRNPQCYFDIETEKLICEDYQNGVGGAIVLAKKYGCPTAATIYSVLKANGVKRRSLSEARRLTTGYTLNEDSFTNINDPETCYWLGVMYTDGYISKRQYTNVFGISVQASDKEWLEKFKKYLNYNGEIHEYAATSGYKPSSRYVRLLIGNNTVVENLQKLGVIEHKTKIIDSLPKIGCMDDFIRGVIDGDGSLRKAAPDLRICGNKPFLEAIAGYLGYDYKIYQDKSLFDLCFNRATSRILEKRLYENAIVYLDRKYQIAKRSF